MLLHKVKYLFLKNQAFLASKLAIIKPANDGKTHPKLYLAKGIKLRTYDKFFEGIITPTTSGILNKKVSNTTILNTNLGAYLFGIAFNIIKTIVIG